MTIRLLIDMNLSPDWVEWFAQRQVSALHCGRESCHYEVDKPVRVIALAPNIKC